MDITYNTGHYNILFFSPLFKCLYIQMHQNQNSKLIMPNPKDKEENSYIVVYLMGGFFIGLGKRSTFS